MLFSGKLPTETVFPTWRSLIVRITVVVELTLVKLVEVFVPDMVELRVLA